MEWRTQPSGLWEELALQSGFRVTVLARLRHVSVRRPQQIFRAARGIPPRAWLKELRFQRALRLLAEGQTNKEIAVALGYHDASSFRQAFRKRFGCSPQKFARVGRRALPQPGENPSDFAFSTSSFAFSTSFTVEAPQPYSHGHIDEKNRSHHDRSARDAVRHLPSATAILQSEIRNLLSLISPLP